MNIKALVLVLSIVIISLCTFFYTFRSLKSTAEINKLTFKFPSSFQDLKSLDNSIRFLADHEFKTLLLFFCSLYIIKQSFFIPGSFILNMFAGIMFRLYIAFPVVCLLATIGASCCYILAYNLGRRLLTKWFSEKLLSLEESIRKHDDNLLYFLIFIRVIPMTPNWFLNIALPFLNIPLLKFAISIFIGLMPYHFICVRAGSIISTLESKSDIFSWNVLIQLTVLSFISILPIIIKRRFLSQENRQYIE